MIKQACLWTYFCLAFFAANCPAQQSSPAVPLTLIRAGTFIDVEAGRALTNQLILVRGAKKEGTIYKGWQ